MATVLLVEDDRSIARALNLRLERNGYEVANAFDASTAATRARQCQPDVAILDISMPGGDGFMVAERLRSIRADLPMIFITANSQPEYRERAKRMGARAFFEKPFEASELLAAVAAAN